MALNEQRLRFVLTSPSGPVGRHLATQGVRAESVAKALATSEGLVRTGRYRSSIKSRLLVPLAVELSSDRSYARYLERGTPAHRIPLADEGHMFWRRKPNHRAGWIEEGFNVRVVEHPGTPAYGILGRAVRAVFVR